MAHVVHIVVIHEVTVMRSSSDGRWCLSNASSSLKVDGVRMGMGQCIRGLADLREADCSGLFTETLTAQVKTVFSDETGLVATQTTARKEHT